MSCLCYFMLCLLLIDVSNGYVVVDNQTKHARRIRKILQTEKRTSMFGINNIGNNHHLSWIPKFYKNEEKSVCLYAEMKESEPLDSSTSSSGQDSATESKNEVVEAKMEDTARYPINLPSPILLATSMLLAIASTGSLFELLTNGQNASLGFGPTAAIVVIGFPTGLFLFLAAIEKAKFETEEDDKAFLKGRTQNSDPYR